jgi:hypothetical protein
MPTQSAFVSHKWYSPAQAWTFFRVITGTFLVALACLKLTFLAPSDIEAAHQFLGKNVQQAATAFELILGVWLLTGIAAEGAWIGTISLFSVFVAANSFLLLVGQASCGCLGTIKISPLYSLLMDLLVISACLYCTPRPGRFPRLEIFCDSVRNSLSTAFLFLVLTSLLLYTTGQLKAGWAWLNGQPLIIDSGSIDLGFVAAGSVVETSVSIRNRSHSYVTITGGEDDCSANAIDSLPVKIEPGEIKSIFVRIRVPRREGKMEKSAFLLTDADAQPILHSYFTGTVKEHVSESEASVRSHDAKSLRLLNENP